MHAIAVVLDIDRARAGERGVQHLDVVAHQLGRALVRQPEHVLDDPVVGRPDPERQAPLAHRLRGKRLLRHGDRVTALDGYHGRSDFDAPRDSTHERDCREGIEIVRDLRDPDRSEAGRFGRLGIGDELGDLLAVAPSLGADHQADPHVVAFHVGAAIPFSLFESQPCTPHPPRPYSRRSRRTERR